MDDSKPRTTWTFVTNHAIVLSFIEKHPRITARELAERVDLTERAVRRIIAELEAEKYIEKEKEGRRIRYGINRDSPLRHPTQQDKAVGDLLKVLKLIAPEDEGSEKKR